MVKKIILASSIAIAMMACSGKGSYTCVCKPTETNTVSNDVSYYDTQTTIMTEVPKSLAEEKCLNSSQTSGSTTVMKYKNGVLDKTEINQDNSLYKSNCTLTEK